MATWFHAYFSDAISPCIALIIDATCSWLCRFFLAINVVGMLLTYVERMLRCERRLINCYPVCIICFVLQPRAGDGRQPGQVHFENLCMKAVNQSIGTMRQA